MNDSHFNVFTKITVSYSVVSLGKAEFFLWRTDALPLDHIHSQIDISTYYITRLKLLESRPSITQRVTLFGSTHSTPT